MHDITIMIIVLEAESNALKHTKFELSVSFTFWDIDIRIYGDRMNASRQTTKFAIFANFDLRIMQGWSPDTQHVIYLWKSCFSQTALHAI